MILMVSSLGSFAYDNSFAEDPLKGFEKLHGNPKVEKVFVNGKEVQEIYFNEKGQTVREVVIDTLKYDDFPAEILTEYQDKKIILTLLNYKKEVFEKWVRLLDDRGNILEEHQYDKNGVELFSKKYTYEYENNRLLYKLLLFKNIKANYTVKQFVIYEYSPDDGSSYTMVTGLLGVPGIRYITFVRNNKVVSHNYVTKENLCVTELADDHGNLVQEGYLTDMEKETDRVRYLPIELKYDERGNVIERVTHESPTSTRVFTFNYEY